MFSYFKQIRKYKIATDKAFSLSEQEQDAINNYRASRRAVKRDLIINSQLVAVDFETTGLDYNKDEIISMGFCPILDNRIRLADCMHLVIKSDQELSSENVIIHGLTDDVISQGFTPKQALFKFIELTQNAVIVAHHHSIERRFLQKLATTIAGKTLPLSFIDTYWFAKLRMQRRQQVITANSLRLFNLRRKQGLPNYNAHNALEDAISTAELYLAQKASLNLSEEKIRLKEMGLYNYKS